MPTRETDAEHFDTVIIGTGFSGLLAAIGLQKKKLGSFVLLERDAAPGGTWRANAYPGAEVDIPTGLYSVSFIPYPFSKKYAPQRELLAYTNHIIETYGLGRHIRTGQAVTTLTYDEDACLWHVATASGERYAARFVIDASGVLANPRTPHIAGAETFAGPQFHTARWDQAVAYQGKRVGVIGSGCSAVQVVSAIADKVARLTVFMGTPEWIIPRLDHTYGRVERQLLTLPVIRQLNRLLVFCIHEVRFVGFRRFPFTSCLSRLIKYGYTLSLKKNLARYIEDDALRAYMMPRYELGCRRVIPTNTYLPALARDNVDVDISGIAAITPGGIRCKDGTEVPLDVIVYATGFDAYSDMKRALTFQVHGRGGRNLNREWESEIVSYKGVTVSGYPNYFKVNGPNTGTGHSSQMSYMETMVNYIIKAISAVQRNEGIKAIDVRRNLQDAYVAQVKRGLRDTVWQTGGCTAFYRKNKTGEVTSLSPESLVHFIASRRRFRLSDYEVLT